MRSIAVLSAAGFLAVFIHAQVPLPLEPSARAEFSGRRARLLARISDGIAIIPAATPTEAPTRFRQSPDFWYLTGVEDPNAALVLDGPTRRAFLYVPKRESGRVMVEGPGALESNASAETLGLTKVAPLEDLRAAVIALGKRARKLYVPLSPQDSVHESRMELAMAESALLAHPLYAGVSIQRQLLVKKLQQWVPHKELADVNPILDELRWTKTPYEIERLRISGRITAEAANEAIAVTRAGGYEYEIEAAVRAGYIKRGARGDAFQPIIASGPNTITWHYVANNRKMQAGEIVLMDAGADYDYYTSDITRTWPVSGRFTPEQEKHYQCILEARDSVISAMKPGITVARMREIAAKVYARHGYAREFENIGRYIGHWVGISVHDVSPAFNSPGPLVAGVVFNVEPILEFRDRKLHYRLEDTILITKDGHENLTAASPASLEGLYRLLASPKP